MRSVAVGIVMVILGGLLIVFGLVDFAGVFFEFDVWTDVIGVQLPGIIWNFSAYIEFVVGMMLVRFGLGMSDPSDE